MYYRYTIPQNKRQEKYLRQYWGEVETIVNLIRREGARGLLYTPKEFAVTFEGKNGLKGWQNIYHHIQNLAAQKIIKFNKDRLPNHKYGHLCVIHMRIPFDPVTGQSTAEQFPLYPTHEKNAEGGIYVIAPIKIDFFPEARDWISPFKRINYKSPFFPSESLNSLK
jgi:hypothetical protein